MVNILLIALGILIALLAIVSFVLARFSVSIRRRSPEDSRRWLSERLSLDFYDRLEKTDYTVKSYDGYTLHAQWIKNPSADGRYVLITHGYTDNHIGSLKYAKMYLDLGFHVIVWDLRGHGLNEPTYCTYSIRESRDLKAMILDSRRRFQDIRLMGLHGESLGSATSAAVLRYKPPVDFAVLDCGFSEIASVMRHGLRMWHLPGWLAGLASCWVKALYGWRYGEMRPVDALAGNTVPLLLIHGAADDFIPPRHSEDMKNATAGYAELRLIENAGHAASVLTAPDEYSACVKDFLTKIGAL